MFIVVVAEGLVTPARVRCSNPLSRHMELLTEFIAHRDSVTINIELLTEFWIAQISTSKLQAQHFSAGIKSRFTNESLKRTTEIERSRTPILLSAETTIVNLFSPVRFAG